MKFTNSENKIAKEDLNKFELKFGLKLPNSYKKIILEYNGGYPEKEYFRGGGVYFTPIKYGNYTMEKSIELSNDFLPKGFYPFAEDGGGWMYCINMNDKEYGKIYFFREDGESELVSNSFDDFMAELSDDLDY